MNQYPDDTQFDDYYLCRVRETTDGYDLSLSEKPGEKSGIGFFLLKEHGVEPKEGQQIRLYDGGLESISSEESTSTVSRCSTAPPRSSRPST